MVSYTVHEPLDLNEGGIPPHLNKTLGGRYGVQKLLGVGRTSRVYQARVFPSGEEVAVKVLREHCNTKDDLERLKWENRVLSSVRSEYFARPLDISVSHNESYLVSEIVPGQTLASILKDYGRLKLIDAIDVGIQLIEALENLHSSGIVHGSFNTTDVMLAPWGSRYSMRLVDLDSTTTCQSSGLAPLPVFGEGTSFDYMSPEQASGAGIDAKTDVYVFGLIFYEMVTGRRPFFGSCPLELLSNRVNRKPDSIASIIGHFENLDIFEEIVSMCLAPDRHQRFNSLCEIKHILLSLWQIFTGEEYVEPRRAATMGGARPCHVKEDEPGFFAMLTRIFQRK